MSGFLDRTPSSELNITLRSQSSSAGVNLFGVDSFSFLGKFYHQGTSIFEKGVAMFNAYMATNEGTKRFKVLQKRKHPIPLNWHFYFGFSGIQKATHPYHLIEPSFLPLVAGLAAFSLTCNTALYLHGYVASPGVFISLAFLLLVMATWFGEVVNESVQGFHTTYVQRGLRQGMILFIISEVMVFFSAFWAFFNASLHPTIAINSVWPPAGIDVVHPFHIPLINTLVLLLSGFTVTYAHHGVVAGQKNKLTIGLMYTIVLAVIFTLLQGYEYLVSPFTMSDGVYGSVFYALTGLHGLHVIIGTIILTTCFFLRGNYSRKVHVGLECGIWYWHFVDVVWLLLYICVYCSVMGSFEFGKDQIADALVTAWSFFMPF